jgi:plasmid rolling circle replication initiator protein Rep
MSKELKDVSASGRQRPWKKHKLANKATIDILYKIDHGKKARNIADCGDVLEFGECPNGHGKKLKKAYFCKDRVCSMCNWRKALFTYAQFFQVAHKVSKDYPGIEFVFLTLTVKNCELPDLSDIIKHYFQSYRRFLRCKPVKCAFKGTFRSLEVTYNPLSNTFHPHLHIVVAVGKKYFKGKNYIKHAELKMLWKRALQVDYNPNCYIEKIKPRNKRLSTIHEEVDLMDKSLVENALIAGGAEVAKYSVKIGDIVNPLVKKDDSKEMVRAKIALRNDPDWQATVLKYLVSGMKRHRLIAYSGVFKEAYQALKCTDVEESELIHIPGEDNSCKCPVCQSELTQLHYVWNGKAYIERQVEGDFSPKYYKRKPFSKVIAEYERQNEEAYLNVSRKRKKAV